MFNEKSTVEKGEILRVKYPNWFIFLLKYCRIGYIFILILIFFHFQKDGFTLGEIAKFLILFFILVASTYLFKFFKFYISANEGGLRVVYTNGKEVSIKWDEIVEVRKSPLKIPSALRKIRCSDDRKIALCVDMKNYNALIELIKSRAINLKRLEE